MIELEEQRIKFEQEQLERETRQRHEERQFQLQMMQMTTGRVPGSHIPYVEQESSMSHKMHTFQYEDDNTGY